MLYAIKLFITDQVYFTQREDSKSMCICIAITHYRLAACNNVKGILLDTRSRHHLTFTIQYYSMTNVSHFTGYVIPYRSVIPTALSHNTYVVLEIFIRISPRIPYVKLYISVSIYDIRTVMQKLTYCVLDGTLIPEHESHLLKCVNMICCFQASCVYCFM